MLQKSGRENHRKGGAKTSTGFLGRISEPATMIKHGGLERENSFRC